MTQNISLNAMQRSAVALFSFIGTDPSFTRDLCGRPVLNHPKLSLTSRTHVVSV